MTDEPEDLEADTDVFEEDEAEGKSEGQEWTLLPAASLLTPTQADALLRRRRAKIITVIGERNGGKTTLVAEIYERYLRGNYANFNFAQSLSLIGFEQKTFQSRAQSQARMPDTPRTSSYDGLRFFHLGLSEKTLRQRMDLLISERAGEVYREARDRPAMALELVEVRRANIIVLIVDGARVVQPRIRAESFASVRDILQAIKDSGAAKRAAQVHLVTTKQDLFTGEPGERAIKALETFEDQIAKSFSSFFDEVQCFRVAARDPTGRVSPASGLEPLLKAWLSPFPAVSIETTAPPVLDDEFDKLMLRRPGNAK